MFLTIAYIIMALSSPDLPTWQDILIENQVTIADNQQRQMDDIESKVDDVASAIGELKESDRAIMDGITKEKTESEVQNDYVLPFQDYENDTPDDSKPYQMTELDVSVLFDDLSRINDNLTTSNEKLEKVAKSVDVVWMVICMLAGAMLGAFAIIEIFKV